MEWLDFRSRSQYFKLNADFFCIFLNNYVRHFIQVEDTLPQRKDHCQTMVNHG